MDPTFLYLVGGAGAAAVVWLLLRRQPEPVSNGWTVGPIINGERISSGTPLHPVETPDGPRIDIPYPVESAGSVHYVTRPQPPLAGAKRMRLVVEVKIDPRDRILPCGYPQNTATLTPYLQRRGDNWGASHATYRWVASSAAIPLVAGVHEVVAELDRLWNAIDGPANSQNDPEAFAAALRETDNAGFICGGGDGAGHGVYATGPASIVVRQFDIEDGGAKS
jgi:hypothetical protein